jgi:nucleotide-binding universal stress UspA family protein
MLIAHASEQLDASEPAFVHAVAMAAHSGAAVTGIHVAPGHVRHEWRTPAAAEDVIDALLGAVRPLQPDVLVLYTHARSGFMRLFAGSVAEGVARNLSVPTLLLPPEAGFVNVRTGTLTLRRALLLAGSSGDARHELAALAQLEQMCGLSQCEVDLLHVEDGTPPPSYPPLAGISVTPRAARGSFTAAAQQCARETAPDVVVMASRGHDQLSDVMWSSHTERVLHALRRPMLWVPI